MRATAIFLNTERTIRIKYGGLREVVAEMERPLRENEIHD